MQMSLGLTLNVIVGFSVVDGRWRGREAILDLDFTISHRCKCQFCQKRFSLRVLALRRVCKQMTIVAMRPFCKTGAKVVLRRSTTLICRRSIIIATARVLPKATQRELFRLGAYSRYWQSHYWQRYFSELWFWSILGIIAHMVSQVIAIFTESLQHKTVYNSLMDISHTYNSLSDVTIHGKMYYNCQRKMRQLW